MNPPFRPAVQLLTASLLLASVVTRSAAAQYYHYKALDFDISITQDGSLRSTERKFNRVVARLIDEPFELTVLSAGDAALRICASSTDRIFLTTRPGELIHSLPCFAEAEHAQFGDAIDGWIWHAGGRDVLASLRKTLDLTEADVRHSADVLREYGNLSSAFVYFVLQAALAADDPGGRWWLASFGAGFSSHGALLDVD